ncbi:hypothetical protein VFPPC_16709 [Pochonia chlamydosporia 170]|uniref:Uncharacterized protein n=1 Tax=Pochonia chlamydosporia 170 TaxID=1380566 RepID=A0A179F6T0_METCM|nr:hypothetical protein VFPPC_16709 [Pochonia chlamydosporia 170]OAQ61148.1 hypothetical protein VFPPC_16709 [Pochonia chlamydosporia 170]
MMSSNLSKSVCRWLNESRATGLGAWPSFHEGSVMRSTSGTRDEQTCRGSHHTTCSSSIRGRTGFLNGMAGLERWAATSCMQVTGATERLPQGTDGKEEKILHTCSSDSQPPAVAQHQLP